MLRSLYVVVGCVALAACKPTPADPAPQAAPPADSSTPPAAPAQTVVPPASQGATCDLAYAETLEKAGLVPDSTMVHGPVEEDAADIGCPYRVSPAPGSNVPAGSTVSYRLWWEAS